MEVKIVVRAKLAPIEARAASPRTYQLQPNRPRYKFIEIKIQPP